MAKIMVVDNESDTVDMVRLMLEGEGHKIVTAYSGKECLGKLKSEKVDLIILDVMMPEMSGWDVFQRIRKMNIKAPVMFLTVMFSPEEQVETLKKEGLCAYLTKPFGAKELIDTVKKCLQSVE